MIREEDSLGPIILVKLGISPRRLKTNVESQIQRGDSNAPQDMTLTPRAKRVIDCAFDEARNLDNNYIGTEHLLLGLIREGDGIAAKTLVPLGATLNDVRRVLIELHSRWRKRRAQS